MSTTTDVEPDIPPPAYAKQDTQAIWETETATGEWVRNFDIVNYPYAPSVGTYGVGVLLAGVQYADGRVEHDITIDAAHGHTMNAGAARQIAAHLLAAADRLDEITRAQR